jgi:hypothetical protein
MRRLLFSVCLLGGTVVAAVAPAQQMSTPNLLGIWSGPWKTVIYGTNPHHGDPVAADVARVVEIRFTMEFTGQDGRLLWGHSWSADPNRKEHFAAAITADGKTIIGTDTDGSFTLTLATPDRIDACYTHPALGPSKSVVASCGTMERRR